jgi:hypothetical protein
MLPHYAQINCQTADYRIRPAAPRPLSERIAHLEQRIAESSAWFGETKGVEEMREQLVALRAEASKE